MVKCHACDVALTYHKGRQVLICHTCDAERPCPPACPACRAPHLHYGGIGTERLEREVRAAFPEYVSRRMDSDTMRTPGSHEQVLAAFKAGEVQILLGTQMIAKGLDFPNVTLVGVVNADTALHLPDFRAAERTFQLVAQVAGRTGRGDRPGRVLVQTYCPEHPAIVAAVRHDYEGFVAGELPERQKFGVPPFGRLVRLIARGPEESAVRDYLEELAAARPSGRRPGGPRPRPGPGADPQDPQPVSLPPPARCAQAAAAPGPGARRARAAAAAPRHRAGDRRRSDQHAVRCDRVGCRTRGKFRENSRKPAKSNLQLRPIGVSSRPFVHTLDSRRRNSWSSFDGAGRKPDIQSTFRSPSSSVRGFAVVPRVWPRARFGIRPGM